MTINADGNGALPPTSSDAALEEANSSTTYISHKDEEAEGPSISIIRGIGIGVCLGVLIFLQASNVSMLTTVSSSIVKDLDAYSNVSWLVSSYLIASSSITPIGGRLSKIFATSSCILFASVVMSIGAAMTAFAPTFPLFLVGRVVAGIGGAFVYGVATIFVIELVSKKRRGLFVALVNSGYTVGVASGAVIAGALEAAIGWRSVFYLQIPLGLVAGIVIFTIAPKSGSEHDNANQPILEGFKRIDYLGVATLSTFIVLLLYSLAANVVNYRTLVISFVAFGAFLFTEARIANEPIIPVEVMKSRAVALTCLSSLGFMMSRWSVLFYTPVFQIAVRGWAPTTAGLILVPTNGGFAVGGLAVGLFHIRRGGSYYLPTLITYACLSVCMLVFSRISTAHPTTGPYVLVAFINGLIAGAALNYSYAHILHMTDPKVHSIITSLTAMFRGFAGSFGSSIGGGIFGRVLRRSLETGFEGHEFAGKKLLIRQLLGSPVLARSLHGEQREVARHSYATAISTLFLAGCVLALVSFVVQAGTGWTPRQEEDEDEIRPLLQNEE